MPLYALPADLRDTLLALIDRGIHPAADFVTVATARQRLAELGEVRVRETPTDAEGVEAGDERHADR